jgi:hypothetical protein
MIKPGTGDQTSVDTEVNLFSQDHITLSVLQLNVRGKEARNCQKGVPSTKTLTGNCFKGIAGISEVMELFLLGRNRFSYESSRIVQEKWEELRVQHPILIKLLFVQQIADQISN